MDVNELVGTIVKELLKQLQKVEEKNCVMVLAERNAKLKEAISENLEDDADVLFFGEDTGGRTPGRYFLPLLSCSAMADLALGRASEPLLSEVLRLLLSGTEVEAMEFEYKAYEKTAPDALYRLYVSYEKTLASYGLKAFQPKRPDTICLREPLVTESDVNQACEQGASVLLVPMTTRVTPLAAESANNLNINILKRL